MYVSIALSQTCTHVHLYLLVPTQRASWQLDPKDIPEDHGHIISNKKKTFSVVLQSKDGKLALKKPIKPNQEVPSEEEFKDFMKFSAGLNHPNILCYDGVFYLESLQMPLMRCSVRQYLEGKAVKRDGERHKIFRGWGRMQPLCLKYIAVGVAKGLAYLHSEKGVSHDGISSSNVLLSSEKPAQMQEVKLVDYQLGRLGLSSQSNACHKCKYMYQAPEGTESTDPKRADLYSLGVLMVYMYTGEPKKGTKDEWEEKTRHFENDPNMVEVWKKVVSKCLNVSNPLTADAVVLSLENLRLLPD